MSLAAQETSIKTSPPADAATAASQPESERSKMPDIAGQWTMGAKGEYGPQEIKRVPDNQEFPFEYRSADGTKVSLQWIAERKQFEGIAASAQGKGNVVLKPLNDDKRLQFSLTPVDDAAKAAIELFAKDGGISEENLATLLNHTWTRVGPRRKRFGGALRAADPNMPDITGHWQAYTLPENNQAISMLHRINKGEVLVSLPVAEGEEEFITQHMPVTWDAEERQFTGSIPFPIGSKDQGTATYTLKPTDKQDELLVDIRWDDKIKKMFGTPKVQADPKFGVFHQRWVRVDPKRPPAEVFKAETPDEIKNILKRKNETLKSWRSKKSELSEARSRLRSLQSAANPDGLAMRGRRLSVELLTGEERKFRNEYFALRDELTKRGVAGSPLEDMNLSEEGDTPNIAGFWTVTIPNDPRPRKAKITLAESGESFQYLLSIVDVPPIQLKWLAEEKMFQSLFAVKDEPPQESLWYVTSNDRTIYRLTADSVKDREEILKIIQQEQNPVRESLLKQRAVNELHSLNGYDRVQSLGALIIETKEGFDAYSEVTGTWDRVDVPLPKDGFPRLAELTLGTHAGVAVLDGQVLIFNTRSGRWTKLAIPEGQSGKITKTVGLEFMLVALDNHLLGFSVQADRGSLLPIPAGAKAVPTVGANSLLAQIGDKTYALSPRTGQWTSPDQKPDNASAEQVTRIPLKHGTASLFRRMLMAFYPEANIQVDERTNSLVVATDGNQLGEIQAILKRMDVPAEPEETGAVDSVKPSSAKTDGELILFWATWSQPAREMKELGVKLSRKGVPLRAVNIDDEPTFVKKHNVTELPTVIFSAGGKELRRLIGWVREEQLLQFWNEGRVKSRKEGRDSIDDHPGGTEFLTLDTKSIGAHRRKGGARIDSPAAQQLADKIARQEAEADQLAERIRNQFDSMKPHNPDLWKAHRNPNQATCLVCHEPASDQEKLQPQENLRQSLAAALDLKFQLEALQVEQLRDRLSRLEQQIGRRQALRQTIIDRRVEELLDGDTTQWDGDDTTSSNARPGASEEEESTPVTRDHLRIHLSGPAGTFVEIGGQKTLMLLPAEHDFLHAGGELPYKTRLTYHLTSPETELKGQLELHSVSDFIARNLVNQKVELPLTTEDINQAWAGNFVTKVVYAVRDAGQVSVQTLVSTRLKPGVDPIAAAQQRGDVVAVLRLPAPVQESEIAPPAQPNRAQNGITIDLYAGDQIYAKNSKLLSKVVQALKKTDDVTVNIKIAGDGDAFVMAVVSDPSQRTVMDARLRGSIRDALKAAGIEGIRWENVAAELEAPSSDEDSNSKADSPG